MVNEEKQKDNGGEDNGLGPEAHGELLQLYSVTCQDLAFFKRQQIAVTNYGILLYLALVGVWSHLKITHSPETVIAIALDAILVLAAMAATLWWTRALQKAIDRRRLRLDNTFREFSEVFNECRVKETDEPKEYPQDFHWLLYAVVILGAVLSILVLLRETI